jgi:inosine-uridine nucleoside N-ribohydrolase
MSKMIIIDTDPGIDDAMAILFALSSPDLEVAGLTTIFGNVRTGLATENALRLVGLARRSEIPVAHGAEKPLVLPLGPVADFVHGVDGLGNTNQPLPGGQAAVVPAARFITDTVMANPGQVTLVPIGPLTNIALALALEPRIVENVAEVVIMGGAATVNGNVNPAAEANIYMDPHAADLVFRADWPLTMVGLDVTMKVIMSDQYLAAFSSGGSTAGEFIYSISRSYLEFHHRAYNIRGAHTHDPSAIAYVIDPTLFEIRSGPVRVVTEGIATGQTLMDQRGQWAEPHAWTDIPATNVCLDVDSERLLALYEQRIMAGL